MKNTIIRFLAIFFFIVLLGNYYLMSFEGDSSAGISCSIKEHTGLSCSGCGAQRALHEMLHGNFKKAFFLNPLFFTGFPFLLYLYYIIVEVYITRSKKPEGILFSSKTGIIVAVLLVIFMIIRNIPVYPLLLFRS